MENFKIITSVFKLVHKPSAKRYIAALVLFRKELFILTKFRNRYFIRRYNKPTIKRLHDFWRLEKINSKEKEKFKQLKTIQVDPRIYNGWNPVIN